MPSDASRLQLLVVNGHGRSGTTALQHALATRADVATSSLGESPFIACFVDFLTFYEEKHPLKHYHNACWRLPDDQRSALYRRMLYAMEAHRDGPEPNRRKWRDIVRNRTNIERFLKLFRSPAPKPFRKLVQGPKSDPRGWRYIIAKTWPNPTNIERFRSVFPGMRMFYIVRNGIDVVASTLKFPSMKEITFEQACMNWSNGIQADKPMFEADYCALLRHDHLVQNSQRTFELAFERLGMSPDPSPAAFISNNLLHSSFDKSKSSLSVGEIFASRPSAWSNWTTKQQSLFRDICGKTMDEFGYFLI